MFEQKRTLFSQECEAPPPTEAPPVHDPSLPHDEAGERTGAEILADGGCKFRSDFYENGAAWHPRVAPHGEMKCVLCKCKVRCTIYSRVFE